MATVERFNGVEDNPAHVAKRPTIEDELALLGGIAKDPAQPGSREKLSAALRSRTSFVVAKAAVVAGQLHLNDLAAELRAAFDRFISDSKLADKGCSAKIAIAKALYEFGDPAAEGVFLAGIKHVQMEGGFGSPIDAAAELRGYCALGLVRIGHRHAMLRLADLLADPWPQARMFAARALAYSERDEAALLLRFKLLIGDKEIDVVNECMSALAKFRQPDLAEFLSRFLDDSDPQIRSCAALALGETRRADSLNVLRDYFPREFDPDARRAVLLGAATLRIPSAIDWLVELIDSQKVEDAVGAIDALALYHHDVAIAERVRKATESKEHPKIRQAIKKFFA